MEEVKAQGSSVAPSELAEESLVDPPAPPVASSSSHENARVDEDEPQTSMYKASENKIAGRFMEVIDPKTHVDTAAPIDSVKGAVSKFGGIREWRERPVQIQDELDKVQVEMSKYQKTSKAAEQAVKELESTWSLADELRLSVEKAQAEEARARRETELAELRRAGESAVGEVQAARAELAALKGELERSHAAHVQAEEKRRALEAEFERDKSQWQSELEEAEVEAKRLREELMAACDVELKAEAALELLESLKAAVQEKEKEEEEKRRRNAIMVEKAEQELEDVKGSIDKAKGESNHLRFAADSLRDGLERQKAELAALQRREELFAVSIASLEEDLNRATSALAAEVNDDESDTLSQARREAERAREKADAAREEVGKAAVEAAVAKAGKAAVEARLEAVTREIVAANASEEMATASANALRIQVQQQQEEESKDVVVVTLRREEYEELSRRAWEMEDAAGKRVMEAVKLIMEAKDAEVRSLEKLARAAKHTEQRRQALLAATEEAEEAEFEKLSAERELRQWRADHDHDDRQQQPRAGLAEISVLHDDPGGGNPHILSPRGGYMMMPRNDFVMGTAGAAEARKKTTFFPRMVMFLARKRAQAASWKP
ncbi:hypothetical protein QOZ80_3AG0230660 [Eleusine coracana subsp. coracana]|nr:hypothetical protein QOZ80_3AG0230660 [Eleusine coracana subsp. coracana]